jgi:hypothetical protein
MEVSEIDQLPPGESWVVLDADKEPVTIANILNSTKDVR